MKLNKNWVIGIMLICAFAATVIAVGMSTVPGLNRIFYVDYDDGSNIQTKINMCRSLWWCGKVNIPAGNYTVYTQINITPGIIIEGSSQMRTIITSKLPAGKNVFNIITTDNYTSFAGIKNLRINGNSAEGHGIYVQACTRNCYVKNVFINDVGGSAIYLYKSNAALVDNVVLRRNDRDGVHINTAHGVRVVNSYIHENDENGILANGSFGVFIQNNIIERNDKTQINISRIKGPAQIHGNYFEKSYTTDYPAVYLGQNSSTDKVQGFSIEGNFFGGGSNAHDIYIMRGQQGVIQGNHFTYANASIRLNKFCNNNLVNRNYFKVAGDWGIGEVNNSVEDRGYNNTL